jgi:GNAT superfamily N-acetyltransferase
VLEDADAIAEAHVEGWRVGYRGVVPDAVLDSPEMRESRQRGWRDEMWKQWRPVSTCYSACFHGEVVGFAHVGEAFDDDDQALGVGEVYGFYLHPKAWGTGVASAMMDVAEQQLRDLGFGAALLYALRDNPRGRAFYEKVGWEYDPKGDGSFTTFGVTLADVRYRRSLS